MLSRLLQTAEVSSVDGLAVWLGANVNTARNWSKRGSVPDRWLHVAATKSGRPYAWFISGGADERDWPVSGSRHVALAQDDSVKVFAVEEPTPQWPIDPRPGKSAAGFGDGIGSMSSALLPSGPEGLAALTLSIEVGASQHRKDYSVIPRLIGVASAGRGEPGDSAVNYERAGDLALSHEWLTKNLSNTSGKLSTVEVKGDSMAPTLLDGDTIVIDRGVTAVDVDGIYVIDMFGSRLVKRLQRKLDETLVVISDNVAYERETIPRGKVREITVIGRMVWPRVR